MSGENSCSEVSIIGGTYRETCYWPTWNSVYGSGWRAARVFRTLHPDAVISYFSTGNEEIQKMMDTNIFINSIPDKTISSLIKLLEEIGCSTSIIKNIIITNPFYLSQSILMIKDLLRLIEKIGVSSIPYLLDGNPYILNISYEDLLESLERFEKEGVQDRNINYIFQGNCLV